METLIQKLIAALKQEQADYETPLIKVAFSRAISIATLCLPAEQSAIQDAFDSGQANADPKCRDVESGKEYFLKLFVDPAPEKA